MCALRQNYMKRRAPMESSFNLERWYRILCRYHIAAELVSLIHQLLFQIDIKQLTAGTGYQNLLIQPLTATIAGIGVLNQMSILQTIGKVEKLLGVFNSGKVEAVAGTMRPRSFTIVVRHIMSPFKYI